jgi:molecular chaperone Hsp33
MGKDYIVRASASNSYIRAFAAVTTSMVEEARKIHNTSHVATAALGRTLTAAALMSQMLKNENDTITIQIKGDGPLGGIVAVTDSKANVRGYVYCPEVELPLNSIGKLDVGGAVGQKGYLNVITDMGLKEPYIGYVDLVSGEIAEDIAYYYATSEQIPSVVALGVLINPDGTVKHAGGYIIQLMPGASESVIELLEKKISEIKSVTSMMDEGMKAEDILENILGDLGLEITSKNECRFKCNCSRDRMERNLLSLGKKEIEDILQTQQSAELVCHFCNSKYLFDKTQLTSFLDEFTRLDDGNA